MRLYNEDYLYEDLPELYAQFEDIQAEQIIQDE
jgi:hypothetical protein